MGQYNPDELLLNVDGLLVQLKEFHCTVRVFHDSEMVQTIRGTLKDNKPWWFEEYSHGHIVRIDSDVEDMVAVLYHFSRVVMHAPGGVPGLPNMGRFPYAPDSIWPAVVGVTKMAITTNSMWADGMRVLWIPAALEYLRRLKSYLEQPQETPKQEPTQKAEDLGDSIPEQLYWFGQYYRPLGKDIEQWETLKPYQRLENLYRFPGILSSEPTRDSGFEIPPWFQDGQTFRAHFPGLSLETMKTYERKERGKREPARSAPHNAVQIGDAMASKGSTKIKQTPREKAVQDLYKAAADAAQENQVDQEIDTVANLNSCTKSLELLGLSPVATYSEGMELLKSLERIVTDSADSAD